MAQSVFLSKGKRLWEENVENWDLRLTKIEKVQVGLYIILEDFSQGLFPPRFTDQQEAYRNEINLMNSMPGVSTEQAIQLSLSKPFWWDFTERYFQSYSMLFQDFKKLGVRPPAKLLELGCGGGWMAEFLAITGFDVTATTLAPQIESDGGKRLKSIEAKGLEVKLKYLAAPMETIDTHVSDRIPFDCVFVYEALHHAYDWKETIGAAFKCLVPGGWLLIAREPNYCHTAVSYRIAKISKTHEIGFTPKELRSELRAAGFTDIQMLRNRMHLLYKPIWMAARKPL